MHSVVGRFLSRDDVTLVLRRTREKALRTGTLGCKWSLRSVRLGGFDKDNGGTGLWNLSLDEADD